MSMGVRRNFSMVWQRRHFTYPYSGCKWCNANGPTQNALPFLHHSENSSWKHAFRLYLFEILCGKNKFHHVWPTQKNFWKNPLVTPPRNNSSQHPCTQACKMTTFLWKIVKKKYQRNTTKFLQRFFHWTINFITGPNTNRIN